MKNCLQAYLKKQIAASDFAVHYHIGNLFSGETDFRIDGNGKYELWSTVTEGRQRKKYSGQLEVEQVEKVVEELIGAEIWKIKHFLNGPIPDDTEVSIEIQCPNNKSKVALWVSEIRRSPQFEKMQQKLLNIAHTLSAGEILETGR